MPNPCFKGKCSQTTATAYKCTCESEWGGAKCDLQNKILRQNTFRQCKKSLVHTSLKIPVDTSVSNVTIETITHQSLNDCHQQCCEHLSCRAFTFLVGVCVLKSSAGGSECGCMCDEKMGTDAPSCKDAKLMPECTTLCTTEHTEKFGRKQAFYTITKQADFSFCAVQSGIQNIDSVLARESGLSALGSMMKYMSPIVRFWDSLQECSVNPGEIT